MMLEHPPRHGPDTNLMENHPAPQDVSPASSREPDSPELIEGLFRFEPRPRRLGEIMRDLGMVAAPDVERALAAQVSVPKPLGEILVEQGSCTAPQVARALEAQAVLASPLWLNMGRFRWAEDLGTTQVDETHRQAVVLSLGDRHVQLTPEEFALAEGIVEEQSFGDIARRCWERTEQLVWPEQVLDLTGRLWALGMIRMARDPVREGPDGTPADVAMPVPSEAAALPGPRWARWAQIRVPLHDPSRLLDRTLVLGLALFSRPGLIGMALLVALACGVLAARGGALWTLIVGNVTHQWVGGLGSVLVAMLICSVVHEYGHAMACRAFGGRVRRMGLMIYVLAPMAFCDVSDAHRFPEKRHRIVVGAAGIYVQLGFAALCAIAWAWMPLPGAIALMLAQVVAVTVVSTLANLNPLLKLDGYYMLMDWLEIPNLRSRAFAMLDQAWQRLWGRSTPGASDGSPREQQAFLWYGILGGTYTVAIAGYMTWMIAHTLLRAFSLE